MAYADYRLCDVCGSKAFYDASLNYESKLTYDDRECAREAGCDAGYHLEYLGDWAVICQDCAKNYKVQIVATELAL